MEDKAKADGVITLKERQRIDHAQDKQSRSIQRESHDRQRAGNEGKRRSEREQRERPRD